MTLSISANGTFELSLQRLNVLYLFVFPRKEGTIADKPFYTLDRGNAYTADIRKIS